MITPYRREDFAHSPMVVFYELTRACDLKCVHCRAVAQCERHPDELSTRDARCLIMQLAQFPRRPLLVFTGGDPLKRPDVFELVRHATNVGLHVAMTPSATPLLTTSVVERLTRLGLHRLAVSLDGADAATHDGFRGVAGSFDHTLSIIADARRTGLPVQINTTVARHNIHQVDAIADLLATMSIELWSVFFLVPTGRAQLKQRISARQCEKVFARLADHARRQSYPIKSTEAPHFRRYLIQHVTNADFRVVGTNDGKGVMFISHTGEIYPSGFLPICCGRFPLDSVIRVYQEAELFKALRDPDRLGGKCGVCEFRDLCGGSRARAFAVAGDPLSPEPDCAYIPPHWANPDERRRVRTRRDPLAGSGSATHADPTASAP